MAEKELIDLQKLQVTSWIYLFIISVLSWILADWTFCWSVFAGGIISILSFSIASTDVKNFVTSLLNLPEEAEEEKQQTLKQGKKGFIIKFWIRIVIIGVVLYVLIRYLETNIFGLILGLSTVVFTVTFTALSVARHYFIRRR